MSGSELESNPRSAARLDTLARAILDAIDASTAILDPDGAILAVNIAWREFARENAGRLPDGGVGINYLSVADAATGLGSEGAEAAAAGIRCVLSREVGSFELEYPCHSPDKERWMHLRGAALDHGSARAIVFHSDVTNEVRVRRAARQRFAALSSREIEVLKLVVKGMASKSIAEVLEISHNTVENHRRVIIKKTGANNSADLVKLAMIGGVIDAGSENNSDPPPSL